MFGRTALERAAKTGETPRQPDNGKIHGKSESGGYAVGNLDDSKRGRGMESYER